LVGADPQLRLPVILSAREVRRLLSHVEAFDCRVAFTTIYSCGLRLGELLRLEVRDIDGDRRMIHIRSGKGNIDRYVPVPERTLILLR
jgi:integrase